MHREWKVRFLLQRGEEKVVIVFSCSLCWKNARRWFGAGLWEAGQYPHRQSFRPSCRFVL